MIMDKPSLPSVWIAATRPRTLAAGVAPVMVGTALAGTATPIDWTTALACLLGATLIQIGSNFANDAFDGLKGADTPQRVGPQRAVASGLISARAMLVATGVVLCLALLIGLHLATLGGWPILVLGLVSLICAIAYTGGPYPLAYHGLGDLFVFLFFGLFAVLGSAWVQVMPGLVTDRWTWFEMEFGSNILPSVISLIGDGQCIPRIELPAAWVLIAAAVGLQATSIIAVNNLRDIATDATVGKRTLAVRLGDGASRRYIVALHAAATGLLAIAALMLGRSLLVIPIAIAGLGGLWFCHGLFQAQGIALNRYLARSAGLELITAAALAAALML
jgi:1,4-dihydroxy-2-naphthoate octaprenyltransferase